MGAEAEERARSARRIAEALRVMSGRHPAPVTSSASSSAGAQTPAPISGEQSPKRPSKRERRAERKAQRDGSE